MKKKNIKLFFFIFCCVFLFFLNEKNINAANDEVKIINEYLQNLKKIISNSPIDLVASKENEVLNEINFFDKNIFEKLWIYVQQDILDANNINVFVKEIKINNEYYEVEILKIGKISYLFRTSDDKLVGYLDYNDKSYIWKIAEPRVKKEILKAFKIYNKVAIPEMCMLPILAPKKIKILELSQLPQNFDNLIALKKQLDNDINNVNLLKVFFDECLKYQSYLYSVVYVDDEIYVGSLGRQPASIIVFGNLNGYYNLKNKRVYGILNFQKDRKKIEAIDYFKTLSYSKKIKALFENLESGKLFFAPIDISQGRARERLEFGKNIIEYLKSGGLLVYPILLIGLISIIIVIERLIFLKRKIGNSDELTTNIIELIQKKDWQTAENICKQKKWLIAKILLRGIQNKNADAEQMTNVLNAAALFEIPKLERYLSTLNVFAAITPLLGLLGTVVGMIKTFEAISIFGAGDPRLMSAGISEALITTELGLSVAIPILFIHNLLENKVDIVVSDIARDCLRFCNALK